MRIVVVGAGALGGFYGGVLANAGLDVTFLVRGETLRALQNGPLQVRSKLKGDFSVPVRVTDNPADLGQPDLVLLTTKAYDLDTAAMSLAPAVGEHTSVLTVQNGIDHIDRLSAAIPRERIVPGVIYISSTVTEPGVIDQVGGSGVITIGEDAGGISSRITDIQQEFNDAGLSVDTVADIWERLWGKFMVICAMSGVSALTRLTLPEIFSTPESRSLYLEVMEEVAAVARARGVALPQNAATDALNMVLNMPSMPMRGSMAYDQMAGRPLELDMLNGAAVRLGAEVGVPTPMNLAIVRALKPFALGDAALRQ